MSFENMFEPLEPGPFEDHVAIYADEIIMAIEDGVVVRFDYNGFHRVVEPYELGKTKHGFYLLRGYQFAGESFGRRMEGWKLFRLDYISYIEATSEEFFPLADYWSFPKFWTHDPIIVLRRR